MDKWKERLEEILPYDMVTLMLYYGAPLFMVNDELAVAIMGALIPTGTLLIGFFTGLRAGFKPLYSVIAFLAFIPQYWLNLPDLAAWGFYAVVYTGFGFIGMCGGWLVDRVVKKLMRG